MNPKNKTNIKNSKNKINLKNQKGIVLSFEAIFSGLIFCILILNINFTENSSINELIVIQQQNDLLKVWSVTNPTNDEMILDCKKLFHEFSLHINNKEIFKTNLNENYFKEKIAVEGIILDNSLNEKNIRIIVYFK